MDNDRPARIWTLRQSLGESKGCVRLLDEQHGAGTRPLRGGTGCGTDGFTMVEVLMCLAVAVVLMAFALPRVIPLTRYYHLMTAVPAITGAIQSTRYQSIMMGCPYQIALGTSTTSYQVSTQVLSGSPPTCAASFTNVGNAVPWSSSGDVSIGTSVTLQFSPNGTMTVVTAPSTVPVTFNLTNGTSTEAITVSGVGNVSVSP